MITYKQFLTEISVTSNKEISELKKLLYKTNKTFVGKDITPKKFHSTFLRILRKLFNDHEMFNDDILSFGGEVQSNKDVVQTQLNIFSSFIECDVTDGDIDEPAEIYLTLLHHPKDKKINYNKKDFNNYVDLYADAVHHELNHFRQWTSKNYIELEKTRKLSQKEIDSVRPFKYVKKLKGKDYKIKKYREDIEYYSQGFEIESFALNAASELINYFNSDKEALQALNKYSKIIISQSPVINTYNELFKHNSVIMKKFIKIVAHYIMETE